MGWGSRSLALAVFFPPVIKVHWSAHENSSKLTKLYIKSPLTFLKWLHESHMDANSSLSVEVCWAGYLNGTMICNILCQCSVKTIPACKLNYKRAAKNGLFCSDQSVKFSFSLPLPQCASLSSYDCLPRHDTEVPVDTTTGRMPLADACPTAWNLWAVSRIWIPSPGICGSFQGYLRPTWAQHNRGWKNHAQGYQLQTETEFLYL